MSAAPHKLQLNINENYFKSDDLSSPQPHWTVQKLHVVFDEKESIRDQIFEDNFVERMVNDALQKIIKMNYC